MKKRILTLFAALALPLALCAQTTGTTASGTTTAAGGTIGGMSRAEFDRINTEGAAKVAAVKPTSTPLSAGDQKLLMQMSQGSMLQLQLSQAALLKVRREEVRTLAQGEVEEQTGMSQKLTEIAAAKGVTLPADPADGAAKMVQQMEGMSGADLDAYYVRSSGVEGHRKLEATMSTVSRTAKDPALKAVADAALPLIRTHMRVSKNLSGAMGGSGRGTGSSR